MLTYTTRRPLFSDIWLSKYANDMFPQNYNIWL